MLLAAKLLLGYSWAQRLVLADEGYAIAQYDLGTTYYQGNGVQRDYTEAVRCAAHPARISSLLKRANLAERIVLNNGRTEI